MLGLLLLSIFAFLFSGVSHADTYVTATIDHTKIDEDLTDFPVLVHLSEDCGTGAFDASPLFEELTEDIDPNDDFSGSDNDAPNADRWNTDATIQSNKLKVRADSSDVYQAATSRFRLHGNFDVQIDYELVDGTAPDVSGWSTTLYVWLPEANGIQYRIGRNSGDRYVAATYRAPDYNKDAQTTTVDRSGKFRISRSGSTISVYFWGGSAWTALYSWSDCSTTPAGVGVYNYCSSDKPTVETLFDNFQVNTGTVWFDGHRKRISVRTQDGIECYTEIERWDPVIKEAWLWTKVPYISATENTILNIYYDKEFENNVAYVGEASEKLKFQMVVDQGSEGTYDAVHANQPCVLREGDTYKMWYSGHDGSHQRILYATSLNGVNWSGHQLALDSGSEGTYDTLHAGVPWVVKDGGTYKMWYRGHDGTSHRILYATSQDGITWSGHQLALDIGVEGTYDTAHVHGPCVTKEDGLYRMWYGGHDGTSWRILYATSTDGITWFNHQMVMDRGVEGTSDSVHAMKPFVMKEGDTYKMWYTGHDGSNYRILYATSTDGINWTNTQMVVDQGSEGTYDTTHANGPCVVKDGDAYHMWYSGHDGTVWRILYSKSYVDIWKTPAQNVWDKDFAAVYHLGQDPTGGANCIKDSTHHKNHGTPQGAMTHDDWVAGAAGQALELDGNDDWINLGDILDPTDQTYTAEILFRRESDQSTAFVLSKGNRSIAREGWSIWTSGTTALVRCNSSDDSSEIASQSKADAALLSTWLYLTVVLDRDANEILGYADSSNAGWTDGGGGPSDNNIAGFDINTTDELAIGCVRADGAIVYPAHVTVGEVRISESTRSPAWIKATYHTCFDDLIAFDSTIDITPPTAVDNLVVNGEGDCTSATLDWTGYDETGQSISHYRIYVETAPFSDISTLSEHDRVDHGNFTYTVEGLECGTTYYFAVVPVDYAGNAITSVTPPSGVITDTVAPVIISVTPTDGSLLSVAPATVVIEYDEAGSGLDVDNSALSVTDESLQEVSGNWTTSGGNQLIFTPTDPLADSTYTINVELQDAAGNRGALFQSTFTVDSQAPAAPTITGGTVYSGVIQVRPAENESNTTAMTLTGTREDNSRVKVDTSSAWMNSGNVLRVGSGQTYSTIQAAVNAAKDGDTVLIEPGTYNEAVAIHKWINIKGNTLDVYNDEVLVINDGNIAFGISRNCPFDEPIYVEGLTLQTSSSSSWNCGASLYAGSRTTGKGKIIWNRCRLLAAVGNKYPFCRHYEGDTELEFENCYVERGYAHYLYMENSSWALKKSQLNDDYFCYLCDFDPDPMDYVTTETAGYGPNYGTWYVTSLDVSTDIGSGDWSVNLTLPQGANALEVWAEDEVAHTSPSVWVDILVDSIVPVITSITPANNSLLNTPPATVVIGYNEAISGLSIDNSTHTVTDETLAEVSGDWTESGGNQLVFTPTDTLDDGTYTVDVELEDAFTNRGFPAQHHFTVDTTAPPAPGVDPVSSPTHTVTQLVTGTREADAAIWLEGEEVVGHTAETTWQHTVTLTPGTNQFGFTALDQAGNESEATVVEIVFDDIAPPAVDTLTLNEEGNGTTLTLNWTGYDESAHGDVDFYRVYAETASFSDVTGLTVRGTVSAGHFTYTAQNLARNTTYWFAVVAVDQTGNANPSVTPVSGAAVDVVAPEDATNLGVECFDDRLVFSWTHSVNSDGDLAGYKAYFDNDPVGVTVPASENTFEKTGLSPATAYPFKVTAYDNDTNESAGITMTGITLLANPTGLATTPQSGYVELSWNGASPSQYVKHYRVYVSETDFTTVEGMSRAVTATGTSAMVAGLTNSVTYYFAVTTVNLSDGERKTVTTVSETPVADTIGPEITNVRVDGVALLNGHTLTKPATFTLNASDPAGVSRVEFSIDGTLIRTDYNPQYSCYWNIVSAEDGSHTLTIVAYDTLGNSTTIPYNLVVALAVPGAPVITAPQTGLVTNDDTITVSGQAEKYTEIIFYNNSAQAAGPVAVDAQGNFSIALTLDEGDNQIQAAAQNRAGIGPLSSVVLVTLDTAIPPSPTNVTAQTRTGGVVRITWRAPADTAVQGYDLYRAQTSFTTTGEATKVNTSLLTGTSFDDLPSTDGTYFYRLTTTSTSDNVSDLSQEVSAVSDRTLPRATSIAYTAQGNFDPQSGRMAPGTVDVVLTIDEPLMADPFLSITPEGGVPLSVELIKETDTTYTGLFVITESTPTGTGYAVFSGRDVAGNRGTEIDSGATIEIDTDGPSVSRITIAPVAPIKNDETVPADVTVIIGLTDTMKPGEVPQLSYLLSGAGRTAEEITGLSEVTPESGEAQAWQAVFTLLSDAGLAETETMQFVFSGIDDLDNVSDEVLAPNSFQVYQGELPPLEPPEGLTGQAFADGRIKLTWNAVEGAAGYQLYRKAPGETELTAYERLGTVLEYIDEPDLDGLYTYAMASIRQENEQESVSGMSAPVEVASDATAPGAPQNLALELVPQGIKAQWEAPAYTEPVTYSLYRVDLAEITSVEGLTPLATGIAQTMVIDPQPSLAEHCYVVTAVDEAGNESAPSNSVYLNPGLLPVSSLTVLQQENDPPVVSWTHPGGDIAGYDIYLGPDESRVKLNDTLLAALSYTDTGYAEDERRYTVIAKDNYDEESMGRSITLPVVRATLAEGSKIKRGIMNRLQYEVENLSASAVDNICLKVNVNEKDHISESFSLQPPASSLISVVVGGYGDLPAVAVLTTTIEITPNAGEKAEIVRSSQIEVGDGMLVLQILNEEFTRGGAGKVWFTLENTGEEEIEIITARNSGSAASNEVILYLLDGDDNVLSSMYFKQALGDGVVTLSNGNTVARIPAGATFTSEPVDMPVPANAPDDVAVELAISHIYYHHGKTDQVKMDGLSSTREVTLIDTSYHGEVSSITPQSSTGDEDIVISGRAVERATELPMPEVPLELVISVNGFDRTYQIFTDADGNFSYTFTPLAGESGIYTVRTVHPDLLDRPVHGQFVINRVSVSPATLNLSIPTNYEKTVNIRVSAGEGTAVNNLSLVYEAQDQPGGVFPEGVHLSPGSPVAYLGSRKTATLSFTIWADNTAAETGSLVLKVKSDETVEDAWGSVLVNTHFTEARPVLYFRPDHVETGVAHDDTVTETIVLENKGLAAMEDVLLSLLKADNTAAPSWVYLNTPAALGSIAVGNSREVNVAFSPTASVSEGVYDFKLRVTSPNHATTDINLYVSVTQSGIGNALFKVTDIYTGTLDENNEIIQGLSNAKVKVQNEEVLTVEETLTTDSLGEAYFTDLPAGRYKCRVTASNHQEHIGRLWIKPGITASEEVFLDYNLVTVEWEVNEITIEDKYEIVLTTTFETDVPAAVVVAEPSSVTLPAMEAGDVYNGEFRLTNYGLIRADAISFTMPADDQFFTYELLGGLPESIAAKSRITVPYRVTCLQSLSQEGDGGGGGCERYSACIGTDYGWECANGQWTIGSTNHYMFYDNGQCTGGGGGGGSSGGGTWYVGGPSGGGNASGFAPTPKEIDGVKCLWDFDPMEWLFEKVRPAKETLQNIIHEVGCSVNTVTREFTDDAVDLAVKVPGGQVSIQRWFYENQWRWEHTRNNLEFNMDALGAEVESIDKGGVMYEASSSDANVYTNDIYRIIPKDSGHRWEDKRGNWKEYDDSGRMTSYGNRNGTVGKLVYEVGEDGKLVGITDRNDTQVIWYEYNVDGLLSAVHDVDNRRVEYTYTGGLLTTITDVLDHDTTYQYNGNGRMTRKVDAAGRETVVTYDDYGNVASVVDNDGKGHFFDFDYDEAKKESYAQIKTSSGMIKEVWYDRDGETKQVDVNGRTIQKIVKDGRDLIITDEKGNVRRKEFDEWDNLTRVIYPDGTEVSFEYEHDFNKVIQATDARSHVTTYAYDDQGNLLTKIEAVATDAERTTTFTYDDDGQLLTATVEADANTEAATITFTYDDAGNVESITDPEQNMTQFVSYDAMGNLLEMTDPRQHTWTFAYDDMGRLESQTDPLNNTTAYEYDGANNRTAVINAYLKRFEFEYDDHNNLIRAKDPYEKYVVTDYNTDNLPVRTEDQEGKEGFLEYDNEGRLTKSIDGAGNEIVYYYDETTATPASSYRPVQIDYPTYTRLFTYDNRQRVVQEVDVLDAGTSYSTTFVYDAAGNVISETDEENNATTYEYDALNRLAKTTDSRNGVTQKSYDDRGNLIFVEDPNDGITQYEYDKNNRLVKVIRPMAEETAYEYDEAGNRTAVVDAKDQKIAYEYNEINRLVRVRYFDPGDHVNPVKTVDFTYNKLGNILTYNDGTTSATYTYDDLQRKLSETVDYGPFALGYSYTYYANGLKKTFAGPDNVTIDYTYNGNNRISGISIPGQGQVTYNTYTWNRPAKITLPGGSTTDYTYDPLMQLKTIAAKDPGQNPFMTRDYMYSPVGNITAKNTEHGNYAYQYDELYRLTGATNPNIDDEAYTYDAIGNRLTAAGVTGPWDYNANNELLGYDTVSFAHDDNGNMSQKTVGTDQVNYIYDVEDRLVRVEDGSSSVIAEYYYDPFGRRLWKDVGGSKTCFHYADEGLIGEYDVGGAEIKAYGYAPDSQWTTDALFVKISGTYYWYQNDHLGTPQKIIRTNGSVAWGAVYDSFGNAMITAEDITNNLRLPGQYFDAETGLYYNLNRYYDPITGRYLRTDPFGDGLNLYAYCFGNPVNWMDPLGLCAVKPIAIGIQEAIVEGAEGGWYALKQAGHDLRQLGLRVTKKVWSGTKWLWRHGYVDIGISFSATGTLGPGLNLGIQISPTGLYWYYGVGVGIGAGASATVNVGTPPSPGVSVTATARGGSGWGGLVSGGVNLKGEPVGSIGGGAGILGGATITVTRIHGIVSW